MSVVRVVQDTWGHISTRRGHEIAPEVRRIKWPRVNKKMEGWKQAGVERSTPIDTEVQDAEG